MNRRVINLGIVFILSGLLLVLIKSDYITFLQIRMSEREGLTEDQLGVRLEDD